MKNKSFYRCACCDQEFDSPETCREHFRSMEHKMVAVPAWIRYVARTERDSVDKPIVFENIEREASPRQ